MKMKALFSKSRLIQFVVFLISMAVIGAVGYFAEDTIGESLAAIGNFFIGFSSSLSHLKFFYENHNLILFFKYENLVNPNPQFSFVISEIQTHFIFPNVMFLALIVATRLGIKAKSIIAAKGVLYINLFFALKILVLAAQNAYKEVIFDSKGNLLELINGKSIMFTIFDIANNILNKYGSIGIRPLIVLCVWAFLCFKYEEIRTMLNFEKVKI